MISDAGGVIVDSGSAGRGLMLHASLPAPSHGPGGG